MMKVRGRCEERVGRVPGVCVEECGGCDGGVGGVWGECAEGVKAKVWNDVKVVRKCKRA